MIERHPWYQVLEIPLIFMLKIYGYNQTLFCKHGILTKLFKEDNENGLILKMVSHWLQE